MKIKRYIAKDSRSALSQVRLEMGPDAVILSNKKVNGQIELVAALDFDEATLENKLNPVSAHNAESANEGDMPTLLQLQQELEKLRGIVEGELSQTAWRDMARRPSTKAALSHRLTGLGLSRTLSGSIADALPSRGSLDELWQQALVQLTARLTVTDEAVDEPRKIIALVGSTGVGKTTTIAKLAARSVLRHGGRQVGLITTDCYRIGGQEQLQTFAGYLGIPMVVATDAAQLEAALATFASRKLVLIDTAGMSQRDIRLYEQFATLKSVGCDIDTRVVLSATAQAASLHEVVQVFGREALGGAVISKLDEATNLGGVIDVVIRNNLRLSHFSIGQKVPEDIVPARAEYLVNAAVKRLRAAGKARAKSVSEPRSVAV